MGPHRIPILAEKSGLVRFKDIVVDETVRREQTKGGSELSEVIVTEVQSLILEYASLKAGRER